MYRIVLYLFPDMADMAHHDIVITRIRFFPDYIVNLFLREHPARIFCKKLENFKLCVGHSNFFTIPNHFPAYVNHNTLIEDKAIAKEILEEASRLFERVKSETDDVDLAKQALNMEALCQLSLGNPKEVLNLLGEPDFSMTSTEPLLASAYHFLGNKKEARSILQVGIFQHTVILMNLLSIYLGLCLDNAETFEETGRRALAIAGAFNLNKLHPGIILPLYFTIAQGYMKLGNSEKALKTLEKYTQLATSNIYPLNFHGDEYFDLLDGWLENTLTLGSDMPRNQMMMQKSVSESIINCKVFEPLKDNVQFQNMIKRLKTLEENQ